MEGRRYMDLHFDNADEGLSKIASSRFSATIERVYVNASNFLQIIQLRRMISSALLIFMHFVGNAS